MHTGIFLIGAEEFLNLIPNFSFRNLDVILSLAIISHERKESVVRDIQLSPWSTMSYIIGWYIAHELIFFAVYIRDIHIMGRWAKIFELFASKDIDSNKMNFGMSVFAGLRSTHFNNLAGTALDDDKTVLTKRRALHGIGGGGASIGALEGVLML